VADEGHGPAPVKGQASDDRRVVAEAPVAVHLHEILAQGADVIEGVRPFGVPGDLDDVDGGQVGGDLCPFLLDLAAQVDRLLPQSGVVALGQGVDLVFEGDDPLLERIEISFLVHGGRPLSAR
jgi:hypothetical protein